MQSNFRTTSDRPITGNLPRMTFCYDQKPVSFHGYYIPSDLRRGVHGPIDHRPTWKGAESTPRQAPSTLIDTPAEDRPGLEKGGFLPHKGEYVHYASAVNMESSLRNLDQPLTQQAFGQRILMPDASTPASHRVMGIHSNTGHIPEYRKYTPVETAICGIDRRYDSNGGMNRARFNNSTRLTTKNMVLPHVEQPADWVPQEAARIGNVPIRHP